MTGEVREVFPYFNQSTLNQLDPVRLQPSGLSLTTDFRAVEAWSVPTWEVEMCILQALILKAFKQELLPETFTRSRYNRLTKILNLSLAAGTQGERQGAIFAANRVLTAFKERLTTNA
jgi:hypothetical protein